MSRSFDRHYSNFHLQDIFSHSRVAIRCVLCEEVDLCPDCFAGKADIGSHLPSHPYKLIDNAGFQLFRTDWTAK
jgi:transcriptional adapter 2-alpha